MPQRTWKEWEMSGIGVHDAKYPPQKINKNITLEQKKRINAESTRLH